MTITLGTPIHWVSPSGACHNTTMHAYRLDPDNEPDAHVRPAVPFGNGVLIPAGWSARDETDHALSTWHTPCR
jgi:hypothetical protein